MTEILPQPETHDEPDDVQDALLEIQALLSRQKRVEDLVHRQDMPHHALVEDLVHKQHMNELRPRLIAMPAASIARILEALPQDESLLVWELVGPERGDEILDELSETVRETLIGVPTQQPRPIMLNAFELQNGRLRQIPVERKEDLAAAKPIWVDIIAPTERERAWVEEIFGLKLPDTDDLTDLEESARFYVEDNGEFHMHSDFLLDKEDESRNVPVAFILHKNVLFSVRDEELPVFRLQRMRARIQPGYVSDGKDVLLDLYAADVEYSADALEDIYAELEAVADGPHAVLIKIGHLARHTGKVVVGVVANTHLTAFKEAHGFVQHAAVARHADIPAHRQRQPQVVVGTMGAHAAARWRMPPVLNIPFFKLTGCTKQELFSCK